MQVRLQPTPFHLARAPIFLANVTMEAICETAGAALGTRCATQHVLEHVARFGLEFVVVVVAVKRVAVALQVP